MVRREKPGGGRWSGHRRPARSLGNGKIKKLVSDRGFGFIQAEDGQEYFFHRSSVEPSSGFDAMRQGDEVSFEVEASPKGPRAGHVKAAVGAAGS